MGTVDSDHGRGLYQLTWIPAPATAADATPASHALIVSSGTDDLGVLGTLAAQAPGYPGLAALKEALAAGHPVPDTVLAPILPPSGPDTPLPAQAGAALTAALNLIQAWLAIDQLTATRLVLLTRGAAATSDNDDTDPAAAAVWGLARSAQNENPDRITLVDLDDDPASAAALPAAIAAGHPQAGVRTGQLFVPRLAPADDTPSRPAPTKPAKPRSRPGRDGAGHRRHRRPRRPHRPAPRRSRRQGSAARQPPRTRRPRHRRPHRRPRRRRDRGHRHRLRHRRPRPGRRAAGHAPG